MPVGFEVSTRMCPSALPPVPPPPLVVNGAVSHSTSYEVTS
jgi:hypothetical protein